MRRGCAHQPLAIIEQRPATLLDRDANKVSSFGPAASKSLIPRRRGGVEQFGFLENSLADADLLKKYSPPLNLGKRCMPTPLRVARKFLVFFFGRAAGIYVDCGKGGLLQAGEKLVKIAQADAIGINKGSARKRAVEQGQFLNNAPAEVCIKGNTRSKRWCLTRELSVTTASGVSGMNLRSECARFLLGVDSDRGRRR